MRHPHWLAAAAMAVALPACSLTKSEDAGSAISRSYPVGAFDKIEVAGPYEVTVTTGSQPSVQGKGGANALDHTVVEITNGTLKIRPRKDKGLSWSWSSRGRGPSFIVTVPSLASAAAAGSASIVVDKVAGERFTGSVAGSGGLKLPDVQVGELALEIAGSGNVEGQGRATTASYDIAGSGNIMASRIASDRLKAAIAGSGNIEGQAKSTAAIDIAGAGNVTVTGGAKCAVSKAGIGNVSCS